LGSDEELHFKAPLLLWKDKLNELEAWDKAREAFQKLKGKYVHYENENMIIDNHGYKLLIAKKPRT
jgi:hypothetical protein